MSYGVIGNANLTNAFGQSAALVTLAAATLWVFPGRYGIKIAGLSLLAALAFLSHVSTIALLSTTLVALVALYWLVGGRAMRPPARSILVATIVAAVFSVRSTTDISETCIATSGAPRPPRRWRRCAPGSAGAPSAPAAKAVAETPLTRRLAGALDLSVWSIGWPIAILAAVGLWRTWVAGARDRLALLVAALGVAFVAFLGVAIFRASTSHSSATPPSSWAASISPPTRRP